LSQQKIQPNKFQLERGKTQMMTRIVSFSIAGFLSCTALASNTMTDEPATYADSGFIIADTRGKERRDDRDDNRDDRQDCRQEEGRIGDDKRDCKQEERGKEDDA
jgi:hypothetical protein